MKCFEKRPRIYLCKWHSFLLIFILIALNAKAQDIPPQFIPPSPDAYALGKYGEVPVSLYTGVPDISIPFYTIKQGDLKVNVSLSYNGSGIKVDEMAPWVGLGWSLNAGGVITRVVRGRPEYLLNDGTLWPPRSDIDFWDPAKYTSETEFIDANELDAAAQNQLDNEPDIYFFNFNGITGSFYFDAGGNALLNSQEGIDIKFQYVDIGSYKFIITTENGNKYEFSDYEKTFFPGLNQMIISAWYLSKITSPTGNEITFEYQPFPSVHHEIRNYTEFVVNTQSPYITPLTYVDEGTNVSEIKIKKIVTKNGWIEFTQGSSPRMDCSTPTYPLDNISIYKSDGSLIKKFKLDYGYFEANNGRKYDGPSPDNFQHLNYRLRLNSIQESSGDNSIVVPPYRFVYLGDDDPTTDDIYTLPYRLSPSQDHWGYFNYSSNEHLFPANATYDLLKIDPCYTMFTPDWDGSFPNVTLREGANREPDAEAMKAGSLSKIYYPTGGYTEFDFGPNEYGYSGPPIGAGLRINEIRSYSDDNALTSDTKYQYEGGALTFDPKYYYFKKYSVSHKSDQTPALSQAVYQLFGLPYENSLNQTYYVKISAMPQAILGSDSKISYGVVTVSQSGNGRTVYFYDNSDTYPDYYDNSYIESVDMFQVDNIFHSEGITDWSDGGLGGMMNDTKHVGAQLSAFDWPYLPVYSNAWKRARLIDKYTYSENGTLLKKESFNYHRELLSTIAGFKVYKIGDTREFIYGKYYIPHALIQLNKKIITQYDINGLNPIVTTTDYYYDNLNHLQPTRIVANDSKGSQITTHISYPLDYAITGTPSDMDMQGIKHLQDIHLLNTVIEKYTQQSNPDGSNLRTISAVLNTYEPTYPAVDMTYNWEPSTPESGFSPASVASSSLIKDINYQPKISFDSYDSNGNILQQHKVNDINHSYIWDYKDTYPVAEATNAAQSDIAYTSFESDGQGNWSFAGVPVADLTAPTGKLVYALSAGSITKGITSTDKSYLVSYWSKAGAATVSGSTSTRQGPSKNGWTYYEHTIPSGAATVTISGSVTIDELRLYPADAQMTTYTYEPLIGMTSQCGPDNTIQYYEYDGLGRLKDIRDMDHNIVKTFEYHYKQ